MSAEVSIYEVGPRDGLQNEADFIATADKIALINLLSGSGLGRIEVTSFVSPRWVPQLADAAEVLAGINRSAGIRYAALTPNLKGFQTACDAGVDEVAIFAAASEGFSRRNINCSIAESLHRFTPVAAAARARAMPLRGYISCVVECPYDGPIEPAAVADVASALLEMGCYELSLGDTIGRATPSDIERLLRHLLGQIDPHDTGGRALANVEVALAHGLRTFDSAIGGLGGCPYAPGAKGNVSTLPMVRWLQDRGWDTGLDLDAVEKAERFLRDRIGAKRSVK
jgi:hydroxymethylglutaryl-CoA lyase